MFVTPKSKRVKLRINPNLDIYIYNNIYLNKTMQF